jgi:2'-5' RNA ligase
MYEQLSLPGLDAASRPFRPDLVAAARRERQEYGLFLAIFPAPEDAACIARAAADLCARHGLAGTPLPPARLHVTLHELGRFADTVPQAVVDAARAAARRASCPPLPLVFDQALSFARSEAFVLRCDAESDRAVARLRQPLARALRRVGLRQARPSRTPHMTLRYGGRAVPAHAIPPLRWTATRFALILSHLGLAHHQWIDQWPLAEAA